MQSQAESWARLNTLKGVGLRGEKAALGDEEAVGCDAEAGMVVKAAPAAALVVSEGSGKNLGRYAASWIAC
jgi:hypothetical protein